MTPPLPPELIQKIVNHLPYDDEYHLQCAALVSRAWSIPSQRALFRHLNLQEAPVSWLCTHLERYPHLQTHIRHVTMAQRDSDSEPGDPPSEGHLAALTDMFSLMPNLTSLEISFDRCRLWSGDMDEGDENDESFLTAFGAFLRDTPSLDAIDIHGLRYDFDFQQMFLYLELNTWVKRVSLQMDSYENADGDPENIEFFTSKLAVVRLPQVETLRFRLWHATDIIEGLKFWFAEHRAMFPGLKHLEIAVDDADDFGIWFRDVLQPIGPTLRLETFRLAFDGLTSSWQHLLPSLSDVKLFDGLHVHHLKFSFYLDSFLESAETSSQANFYTWLSSKFRLLTADSVHFTELTFAVADAFHSGSMWGILDDALSLETFAGVKRVHFETRKENVVITEWAHPDLAFKIRSALPRLDGRGVLCFV